MSAWVCAFVQPHREDIVDARFRAQGFRTLFMRHMRRAHRPGSPLVEVAIFPRYLFVSTGERPWQDARRINGVVAIVTAAGEAITIPAKVIEELASRGDHGVIPAPALIAGRSYRVWNGSPLAGLVLIATEIGGQHVRGWVNDIGTRVPRQDLDPIPLPAMPHFENNRRKLKDWEPIA